MLKYIARRLLIALPTIWGVTILIFLIMKVLPGDPLVVFYDPLQIGGLTDAQRASLMTELGLDRPLLVQYGSWLGGALRGDLGSSFLRKDPITEVIKRRGAISAQIGVLAIVIAWVLGLPAGIISALRPNSVADGIASFMSALFLAIPGFWMALLIVIGLIRGWGYHPPLTSYQLWQDPWRNFQIVIGPALVLGLGQAAFIARMSRSSLFEVFREDYVRTARAKGLKDNLILVRHALPNALLPVLTLAGLILAFTIGGSVTVEAAFGTPGLGNAFVQAMITRDGTMVQSLTMFYAILFVLVNLIVDISYVRIDPRIKVE